MSEQASAGLGCEEHTRQTANTQPLSSISVSLFGLFPHFSFGSSVVWSCFIVLFYTSHSLNLEKEKYDTCLYEYDIIEEVAQISQT